MKVAEGVMIQQKRKHSWIGSYLGADLVAALASLDVDNFTHVVVLMVGVVG